MAAGGAVQFMGAFKSLFPADFEKRPGRRLHGDRELQKLLSVKSEFGRSVFTSKASDHRPVRAILFDKTPENNWSLGWHQDRTIAVKSREQIEGFDPWTTKNNIIHVEPPFRYFENMITIRIHLDSVTQRNAPLRVALGSHLIGKVTQDQVISVVQDSQLHDCLAAKGDVWLYATPILHCSDKSTSCGSRRVLQVDYSDRNLPGALDWAGLA